MIIEVKREETMTLMRKFEHKKGHEENRTVT